VGGLIVSICKVARTALKMTQPAFATWLAERTNGRTMPQCQISRYDTGKHAMNKTQNDACLPIVAQWLAEQTRNISVDDAAELILNALK